LTRVLVTGARGFVGRHVSAAAAAQGLPVEASAVDLLDAGAIRAEIEAFRPDGVIHLAARHPADCASVADAVQVNVRMTSLLLEALGAQAPGAGVLVPGSAAEYGMASSAPLDESAPLDPVAPHGAIKVLLERLALLEPLARGLRTVVTRSFNHVGPGQGPDAPVGSWVRQVVAAEQQGGGTLTTGRLDVTRDFLDVRDVARAYVALLQCGATGIVNVCSGTGVQMREVAERLRVLANVPLTLREDPSLLRSIDPPVVVGDPSRLRSLTGLAPTLTLDDSLRDALDAQRQKTLAIPSTPSPFNSSI
jgi:GDP-4-dehydro-6-deoxy-D-mannose reductase